MLENFDPTTIQDETLRQGVFFSKTAFFSGIVVPKQLCCLILSSQRWG